MSELNLTAHSADFSTSPQLDPTDMVSVAAAGFRSVINNRPDGEGGVDQPSSAALAAAAAQAGLQYAHLPVVPTEIDETHVATFATLLRELPGPVLAFCFSGGRAAKLYRLATGAG